MTSTDYGTVGAQEEETTEPHLVSAPHRAVYYLSVVLLSLAAIVLIGFGIFHYLEVEIPHRGGMPPPVAMVDQMQRCRMCTFKECVADQCPRLSTNCTFSPND